MNHNQHWVENRNRCRSEKGPQPPLQQGITEKPQEVIYVQESYIHPETLTPSILLYLPGDLHQIHLRRASRHHRNNRERECCWFWITKVTSTVSDEILVCVDAAVCCVVFLPMRVKTNCDSALQSPADKTKRIHAGDEVIQVNKQTVVSQSSPLFKETVSHFPRAVSLA